MKRFFGASIASLALAVTVAAQTPAQDPSKDQQKVPDVTLQGCVTQGSGPTVFILNNARVRPDDKNEKSKSFVIVAGAEDLALQKHLNHEVTITGPAEAKVAPVPPPGQTVAAREGRVPARAVYRTEPPCDEGGGQPEAVS
jgi:hypothetical protein